MTEGAPLCYTGRMRLTGIFTFFLLLGLALATPTMGGCVDGDIRKGCKNYCRCHRGERSEPACREECAETLSELRKRDRAMERQVAECLAAKGERSCAELTACAKGVLK